MVFPSPANFLHKAPASHCTAGEVCSPSVVGNCLIAPWKKKNLPNYTLRYLKSLGSVLDRMGKAPLIKTLWTSWNYTSRMIFTRSFIRLWDPVYSLGNSKDSVLKTAVKFTNLLQRLIIKKESRGNKKLLKTFCGVLSSLVLPISSKWDSKFLFLHCPHEIRAHYSPKTRISFSSLHNISPSTTASYNLWDVGCYKDLYDFSYRWDVWP